VKSGLRAIVEAILSGQIATEADLESRKKAFASANRLSRLPGNADILSQAGPEEREQLKMLVKKPTRTLSGVAVIAVMTSPARCPHGICVPCPGGALCDKPSPQSYTGREPAAMRAEQHGYDPYDQVFARLHQLQEIGHPLDKAELIIMGGTMTSRPLGYQHWFIKRCLEAMNDFPVSSSGRLGFRTLEEASFANQRALVRNIGTTFETRPDWCRSGHIQRMLSLGATKVELGVQSISDGILAAINRGHSVEDTVQANHLLREAGLKVGFHMMPGLPGSTPAGDLQMFRDLFEDSRFMPDYLKIYPALVIEGTELFRQYLRGEYLPLDDSQAADLVSRIKELLPRYVRLQRVQRDIPAQLVVAGVKKSNLRQLAAQKLHERGGRCRCIRCREVGLRGMVDGRVQLQEEVYEACGGWEHFLSFERDDEILVGFLRLRLGGEARVRELHIYGPMVPLGKRVEGWQHRGYGARLIEAAEERAREAGYDSLQVTSGIGARGYYERLGYERQGPYMVKRLS